jgi:hypothetical protein
VAGHLEPDAQQFLTNRQELLDKVKLHLSQAQARMKKYADRNRVERTFTVGDMVYLKLQPYRLTAFGLRNSLKLQSKYYGPFRVLARVGNVAYKLQLPTNVNIHPVFHVSQLKRHLGPTAVPNPDLPLVDANGRIKTEPVHVLQTRQIPRSNVAIVQLLVQWANLPPDDATWEDTNFMKTTFPAFYSATIRGWFNTPAAP